MRTCATRNKILKTATRLFSRYGFDGTSVRDIACESQVNLAAINYHFCKKENLYFEIINSSYEEGDRICCMIAKKSKNIEIFSMNVYDHFCRDTDLIRNAMKLILSDKLTPAKGLPNLKRMAQHGAFGPPGGVYFSEFLVKEIAYILCEEAILWGVKSIFGNIVYWSTLGTSSYFELSAKKEPLLRPEQIRKDVLSMVRATVEFMQNHPEQFEKKK